MKGQFMKTTHPYIPNSAPEVQAKMMEEIGIRDIDELYTDIPSSLRFTGKMDIPEPLPCEYDLKRHMNRILAKNNSCEENLNFLGGGCWQHYVPAICDEVNHRSEFLTAYAGEPFEDHGRFQALFEYASMMGELLDMDVVNVPTYDWGQAASTSIRMAARITGRSQALVADTIAPDRLSAIRNYCKSFVEIVMVNHCPDTGKMDIENLRSKLSPETAAVYFENPSFLGTIEDQGREISDMTHANGALSLVGVDPISLGVLLPPGNYGADIVCGDIQPLGIHMQYGGGHAGFIATRDEEKFVMEYPSRLFGIEATSEEGEYGFGDVTFDRTSFGDRENAKEFIGTATALWGITAGVYLALLGPKGITQVGKTILQKSQYAAKKISQINGVRMPLEKGVNFKEFIVDFSPSGK
ncbi:MAG: aminomethyl-transferring glycine dehydrogenase subunit GcvPA, partial [Deltaproteobacteria bacterium]|nr:aminomethyl-transferring glycine dehydrogenase subunit GcvPA [Deltaproteobacteria bacterium]